MAIVILMIATLLETVLVVYSFITKSNQYKIRNWVRICAFITLIFFTIISVVEWSFRWYLLTSLLLIWAISSCFSLIRKRVFNKEYNIVQIAFKSITSWILLAIALLPALIFPQYKMPEVTGSYVVNTVDYTYTDNNRIETFNNTGDYRKVTFEFWYPTDLTGKYPLIVFSHGAFGVSASNTSTYHELASNGYVVCSISHPYHSMYTLDSDGNLTLGDESFRQEVIDANNGTYDNETIFKLDQKWMKVRTEDMNFVLDTIIKKTSDCSDEVYKLIDSDKIGLLGHSLGGAAGAQLGRDREDISAVINLDGDLLGEYLGFVNNKFIVNKEIYPIPLLSIYTDDMIQIFNRVNSKDIVIPQKLISSTAPKSYEVHITGTNHMSLTDLPLFSPFLVKMINGQIAKTSGIQEADKYYVIETMNNIILKFFDCYLKDKGSFQTKDIY